MGREIYCNLRGEDVAYCPVIGPPGTGALPKGVFTGIGSFLESDKRMMERLKEGERMRKKIIMDKFEPQCSDCEARRDYLGK